MSTGRRKKVRHVTSEGKSPHSRSDSPMRRRVRDIITTLFVAKGFHGTGINEISSAVGLARGALYYHIGSKEQVLYDISMELLGDARTAAASVVADPASPEDHLRRLAQVLLKDHAEHGEGWLVAVREARFLSEERHRDVIRLRDEIEAIWRGVFDAGADAGVWRKLDAIDVRGILGMLNSAARWMDPGGPLRPEEIADRYVDLVLNGIVGR